MKRWTFSVQREHGMFGLGWSVAWCRDPHVYHFIVEFAIWTFILVYRKRSISQEEQKVGKGE